MLSPKSKPSNSRLCHIALLTGGLIAVVFITISWGRLLLRGQSHDRTVELLLGVGIDWIIATVA